MSRENDVPRGRRRIKMSTKCGTGHIGIREREQGSPKEPRGLVPPMSHGDRATDGRGRFDRSGWVVFRREQKAGGRGVKLGREKKEEIKNSFNRLERVSTSLRTRDKANRTRRALRWPHSRPGETSGHGRRTRRLRRAIDVHCPPSTLASSTFGSAIRGTLAVERH